MSELWRVVCVFVCVFPGGDETLSLTRCCSVKVKPYRMSGMMTRTERFHLIPLFPLFPSISPICLQSPSPPSSARSFTRQDRHIPAFTYNLQSQLLMALLAYVCVCVRSVKSCHPTSKAKSGLPEASVAAWLAWSLPPSVTVRRPWRHSHSFCEVLI